MPNASMAPAWCMVHGTGIGTRALITQEAVLGRYFLRYSAGARTRPDYGRYSTVSTPLRRSIYTLLFHRHTAPAGKFPAAIAQAAYIP